MTERLVIEITGDLPDAGKYAILADAEQLAGDYAHALEDKHKGLILKVSVKAVRPGKKPAAPIVQATTLAPEPVIEGAIRQVAMVASRAAE